MKIIWTVIVSWVINVCTCQFHSFNLSNCIYNISWYNQSYCLYAGSQENWETAISICEEQKAESTFFENVLAEIHCVGKTVADNNCDKDTHKELRNILSYFLESTFWIHVKRDNLNKQLRYQLLTSSTYQRRVPINFFNERKSFNTAELLDINKSCITVNLVKNRDVLSKDTYELRAEDCLHKKHNFICMIPVNESIQKEIHKNDTCKWTDQNLKMNLRLNDNEDVILEVYHPEQLWETSSTHEFSRMSLCNAVTDMMTKCSKFTNPVCIAEQTDAEMEGILKIKEIENYSDVSDEKNLMSGQKCKNILVKREFIVNMKDNGIVSCYAFTVNKSAPVRISKQIFRKNMVTVVIDTLINYAKVCKQRNTCDLTYDFQELSNNFNSFLYNVTLENSYSISTSIKIISINILNSEFANVTLHATVDLNKTGSMSTKGDVHEYMKYIYDVAQDMFAVNFINTLFAYDYNISVKSTRFCTEMISPCGAVIPVTETGYVGHTDGFCFETDGKSCSRLCKGNFIQGTYWNKEIAADCTYNNHISKNTSSALENLKAEMAQYDRQQHLTAIHYACSSLRAVSVNTSNITEPDIEILADIVDELMSFLQKSNSTKTKEICIDVAHSVEKIINFAQTDKSVIQVVRPNFAVVLVNSTMTESDEQIIGAAHLKKKKNGKYVNTMEFNQMTFKHLSSNENLNAVLKMKAEIAVVLPAAILKEQAAMFVFYRDQSIFGGDQKSGVPVVDVSVKGRKLNNIYPGIFIIFEKRNQSSYGTCAFWDYEENNGLGNWSSTGCELLSSEEDTDVCVCNHLTPFTKLIYGKQEEEISHKDLDIITAIGCFLSLLGLLGIAVTAFLFPEWRKGVGRKVLFNLSSAVGLMTTLVLLDTLIDEFSFLNGDVPCIIMGVLMHFSVLASFSWMFLAACLQYFRLVHVFSHVLRVSHLVLKSSLIGWVLPLIPCCIILFLDVNLYGPEHYCYPNGNALYFGVILPVVCIIICNFSIFVLIVHFLLIVQKRETIRKTEKSQTNYVVVKTKIILFLFILFGLTWIFGFLRLSYLFCFTSSLQGLMFFIFFIVLDDGVRKKWKQMMSKKKTKIVLGTTDTSLKFSESLEQKQ